MQVKTCKAGYSKSLLDSEFKYACKIIKQANKKLLHTIVINKNYQIMVDFENKTFRMKIDYIADGGKRLTYYIAL